MEISQSILLSKKGKFKKKKTYHYLNKLHTLYYMFSEIFIYLHVK